MFKNQVPISLILRSHDIWNGSHPHILVVSKDAQQLINFQMEIKKKITDILKRLLGLDYLSIWEEHTAIIKIGDLHAAKDRIAYLYANPGQDSLEDNIDLFPGASSWTDYRKCFDSLNSQTVDRFPWIKLKTIPELSCSRPKEKEDCEIVKSFQLNKYWFKLERNPNAWMKCFGVKTDLEAKLINQEIVRQIRSKEQIAREARAKKGNTVLGAKNLRSQQILKPHKPKKRNIKIFIISTDKELRLNYISKLKMLEAQCRECYRRWRQGEFSIKWPPGVFKPSFPPLINQFAT